MTPPTQEKSTEVVLELFDELLSLLAICEKTEGRDALTGVGSL